MKKNTWLAKLKRTIGAFFPIASNRKGHCLHCGACCCLPVRCAFLQIRDDGKQYCTIYKVRPLNCKKYPRTQTEFITETTCGFYFDPLPESVKRKTFKPKAPVPAVDQPNLF
jgi:hypothetical protein